MIFTDEEWARLANALPEHAVTKAHVASARRELEEALRPIAARIWEEGYDAGEGDQAFRDRGLSSDPDAHEHPHSNPYAVEE